MNFLCPACKTPLPVATPVVVACSQCGVEVDLTRVDTAPGQAKLWPEVDLAGETLGSFKLTSRAGSGGMGTVYVAEGLTGRCAVKVLSAQMAADPGLRERFRREAQALRKVQHPGVVHIIDEGAQNGFCWYAMEHVEGKDLRARLIEGPMPIAEVEALARQLLEALAAVHDAQLVHRDLKPGNILLSATGARLCDFGIARFDGATTLTESAALLGSLRYMAPEQRAGVTTPKSDLYSLGLVLHEAATGGLPGEKDMPGGRLGKLVDTLLQASPAKRPADARAAAKLVAPRKVRSVGTIAAFASSVLGVGVFAAWAIIATQFNPRTTAIDGPLPLVKAPPPPVVAKAVEGGVDAGPPAAPRVPRVIAAKPVVTGFLEPVIAKLTMVHSSEIQSCYENALREVPELAGKLSVRADFVLLGTKGRTPVLLRPLVMRGLPAPTKGEAPPTPDKAPPPVKSMPSKKSKKAIDDFGTEPVGPAKPLAVYVGQSTLGNTVMEECIVANVRTWEFPQPSLAKATIELAWTFDQRTEENVLGDLRADADVRADAGLIDPREPLPEISTKVPRGKSVKPKPVALETKEEPPTKMIRGSTDTSAPEGKKKKPPAKFRTRTSTVEARIRELDDEVAGGTLTAAEVPARAIALIDEQLTAIGEPREKQDYVDIKELENLKRKISSSPSPQRGEGRGEGKSAQPK